MTRPRKRTRSFGTRFWRIVGSVSIRTKVLGIVVSLMLFLGIGTTIQVRNLLRHSLRERLEQTSRSIAHDLAARARDLILLDDAFALHELLEDTQRNNPDVVYALVLGPDGELLAHTFVDSLPPGLISPVRTDTTEIRVAPLPGDVHAVWHAATAVQGHIGTARVGLSESSIDHAIAGITAQLSLTTVFVIAVGVLAGAVLTWLLTRPILELASAAQAVGEGDFSRRVQHWADDEISTLANAFNGMIRDLEQAERARSERDRLRAQLLERVIAAQEDERKRIARELHDETSQALTFLMVGLRRLLGQQPSEEARTEVERLRSTAAETLEGVRNLARELRPSVLDDLGLETALRNYVAEYARRYHQRIDFAAHGIGEARLHPSAETAVYRIVQEALTNAARHSGADAISVLLERRDRSLRVIVEDNGRGFDPERVAGTSKHLGLHGMRERAELLGGTFTLETRPGSGTSLYVEIPIEASEKTAGHDGTTRKAPPEAETPPASGARGFGEEGGEDDRHARRAGG